MLTETSQLVFDASIWEVYCCLLLFPLCAMTVTPTRFLLLLALLLPGALGIGIAAIVRISDLARQGACMGLNSEHLECYIGLPAAFVMGSMRIGML